VDAGFEYGTIVKELLFGTRLLSDVASLQEVGLSDGDEVSAVCSRSLSGSFGERRIGCPTCGSHETASVTFSNGCAIVVNGREESHLVYQLGELREGPHEMELDIDFFELDGSIHPGSMIISRFDLTKRRLMIPDLDIDVLDEIFLETQRQQMKLIRLSALGGFSTLMDLCDLSNTYAFGIMANSRHWFEADVFDRVMVDVDSWRSWRRASDEEIVTKYESEWHEPEPESLPATGRLAKRARRISRGRGQKEVQQQQQQQSRLRSQEARGRRHRRRALDRSRAADRQWRTHQDDL